MEEGSSEAENLRKQISYLTDLINNAQDASNVSQPQRTPRQEMGHETQRHLPRHVQSNHQHPPTRHCSETMPYSGHRGRNRSFNNHGTTSASATNQLQRTYTAPSMANSSNNSKSKYSWNKNPVGSESSQIRPHAPFIPHIATHSGSNSTSNGTTHPSYNNNLITHPERYDSFIQCLNGRNAAYQSSIPPQKPKIIHQYSFSSADQSSGLNQDQSQNVIPTACGLQFTGEHAKMTNPEQAVQVEKVNKKFQRKTSVLNTEQAHLTHELLKAQGQIEALKRSLSDKPDPAMPKINTPVRAMVQQSVVTEHRDLLSLSPYKLERSGSASTSPQRPISHLRPASSPQRPASSPQRPASSTQRPASSPQIPASSPQRPASSPQRPTTSIVSSTQTCSVPFTINQTSDQRNEVLSSQSDAIPQNQCKRKLTLQSSSNSNTGQSGNLLTRPITSVFKSKYSLKRVSSAPQLSDLQSTMVGKSLDKRLFPNRTLAPSQPVAMVSPNQGSQCLHYSNSSTQLPSHTPSKLLHKSRYSLKRVKSQSASKQNKNQPQNSYQTPTKLVRISKYSMKRVRRSLSGGDKTKKQRFQTKSLAIDRRWKIPVKIPFCSKSQQAAHVIRSKYKIQKETTETRHYDPRISRSLRPQYRHYQTQGKWGYHHYGWRSGRETYSETTHVPYWKHSFGRKGTVTQYNKGKYTTWKDRPTFTRGYHAGFKYVERKMNTLKKENLVLFNPKLKLDRRNIPDKKVSGNGLVMINGLLYKSSRKTLVKTSPNSKVNRTVPKIKFVSSSSMKTITVKGVKFRVNGDGKSLKRVSTTASSCTMSGPADRSCVSRVDIGGVTYKQTQPGMLERVASNKSRILATRVVNRTVARAAARHIKDNTKSLRKKKYCMFYNRFGKCNRKSSCPFLHDPDKIAVCTRFLRGTCKVDDCPFSHKVSQEKMPVCSYFLKGTCNKDDCPYLHVNVNKDAAICQDFVSGYCPEGLKCKKKHSLQCPVYNKTGSCPEGRKCKLQHRKKRKIETRSTGSDGNMSLITSELKDNIIPTRVTMTAASTTNATTTTTAAAADDDDSSLPFRERKLPAYISLKMKRPETLPAVGTSDPSSTLNKDVDENPVLKIRPQFL